MNLTKETVTAVKNRIESLNKSETFTLSSLKQIADSVSPVPVSTKQIAKILKSHSINFKCWFENLGSGNYKITKKIEYKQFSGKTVKILH
jgi:hypothetical protein